MKYFVNTYSSANIPPVITLNDNKGKVLTTLVDNQKLKQQMSGLNMPSKEFFTFKTTDGVELNGWIMKPAHFDTNKKYPVILHQYSGPGSQQVLDRWGIGAMGNGGLFEAYMADKGFIMVCVDGRGTGGRGAEFEKCTYLNLGVKEAKDQVETAKYLSTLPYRRQPHRHLGMEFRWLQHIDVNERRHSDIQGRRRHCRPYRLAFLRLGIHRTLHAHSQRKHGRLRSLISHQPRQQITRRIIIDSRFGR